MEEVQIFSEDNISKYKSVFVSFFLNRRWIQLTFSDDDEGELYEEDGYVQAQVWW